MADIVNELSAALGALSRAVFSQPADGAEYSKVTVRPISLKGRRLFQLECLKGPQAFHRNLEADALADFARAELDGSYRQVLIVSGCEAAQYVLRRDGSYRKSGRGAVARPGGDGAQTHDRGKNYLLAEGEDIPALVDLGVFTADGRVVKAKYDKYRQINRFIELIDDSFSSVPAQKLTILDFGCGKSYLTFIMYYYFVVKRGFEVEMIGYDLKADVVERCNKIAEKYGYGSLRFVTADVRKDALYDRPIDMVVTLHACDTATDYALWYAVRHGAKHIFSVPCCQHEINSSIRPGGELDIFMRHGIIRERMSALLTDSIRAEVLEAMGYAVDLIEFVDFEHSPKNIMIRAEKKRAPDSRRLRSCLELRERYGFSQTLLELREKEGAKKE